MRARDLLERRGAGDVHDQQRRVGDLGEPDRAVRRLRLDRLGRVSAWKRGSVLPRASACSWSLAITSPFSAWTSTSTPGLARDLHRLEQVLVRRVERRALVGHEDLDRRHAERGQRRDLVLDVLGQVGDRDVQAVVDVRLALRLAVPRLDRVGERALDVLEREVDDRRRPAGQRGGACPVSQSSAVTVPPNGMSMCVWPSMKPGITRAPETSTTSAPSRGRSMPIGLDRLAVTATSARKEPSAVTTVPPASTRSLIDVLPLELAKGLNHRDGSLSAGPPAASLPRAWISA